MRGKGTDWGIPPTYMQAAKERFVKLNVIMLNSQLTHYVSW